LKLSLIAELGRLIHVRTLAQSRAHHVPRTPETVEEKIKEVLEERRQRLATLEDQDDPKAEWSADDSPLRACFKNGARLCRRPAAAGETLRIARKFKSAAAGRGRQSRAPTFSKHVLMES
jgi:hypothetical protein